MEQPQMSKEQQIWFHRGSVSTLLKEREELIKMIQNVERVMQAHAQALKELGIDLEAEFKKAMEAFKKAQETKKPGENITNKLG